MKIEDFPFVVGIGQKIALLPLGEFLGIILCFGQPLLAGLGQIITQHPRQVRFVGQVEHRSLRGLRRDMGFQVRCQARLYVLSGIFPILGRLALARDIGRVSVQIQPASGQAAKFVGSQSGLDRRVVNSVKIGKERLSALHGRKGAHCGVQNTWE